MLNLYVLKLSWEYSLCLFSSYLLIETMKSNYFSFCKHTPHVFDIDVAKDETLTPLTDLDRGNEKLMNYLYEWRLNAIEFRDPIPPTYQSTINWFNNIYLPNDNKILFLIKNKKVPIGHIGLNFFFETSALIELDNVIRGENSICKGIMSRSLQSLLLWASQKFNPVLYYLRVLPTNVHAINFYKFNNFSKEFTSMIKLSQEYSSFHDSKKYVDQSLESDKRMIVMKLKDSKYPSCE